MVKKLKSVDWIYLFGFTPFMKITGNFLKLMIVLFGLAHAHIVYGGVDKTLVSWVHLEDESVRAGSILTLQNGSEFDGIVFGELMAGKWMAGSDNWKRSLPTLLRTALSDGRNRSDPTNFLGNAIFPQTYRI